MKKCMRSYFPYLVTIAVLVLFPLMCIGITSGLATTREVFPRV